MQERTSVLVQATPPATARPRLPGGFGPFCQASSTWTGGEETGGTLLPRGASLPGFKARLCPYQLGDYGSVPNSCLIFLICQMRIVIIIVIIIITPPPPVS